MSRCSSTAWLALFALAALQTLGCQDQQSVAPSAPSEARRQSNEAPDTANPGEPTPPPAQAAEAGTEPGCDPAPKIDTAVASPPAGEQRPEPAPQRDVPARSVAADIASGSSPPGGGGNVGEAAFAGWSTPKLAIVLSGEQNGYLEPCGCAGLENMKGGLMRRASLFKSLRKQDWPLVALDLGGMIRRFGKQAELKYATATGALKTMGYDAIGFGPNDLRLGIDPLLPLLAEEDNVFLASNSQLLIPTATQRVIQRGGFKVGVLAVLGDKYQRQVNDGTVQFTPAAEAIEAALPKLKQQCDILVLLSNASIDESKDLARRFKDFDIVVTAGGADHPPHEPLKVEGSDAWLVEVGKKGMYVNVIGLYGADKSDWKFQRVAIDKRWPDAEEVKRKLVELQKQLQALGWRGLGLKPTPHASGWKYVGSQKCGECHASAYKVFEKTPHAHATETLAKLDPPRQFDPECVSCHVTGWAPQQHFPYTGGFDSLKTTPQLHGNGCENCHGPGARHVAIEQEDVQVDMAERLKVRGAMRLTLAQAEERSCRQCHDLDNSPDFIKQGFEVYWPKVEHHGKD